MSNIRNSQSVTADWGAVHINAVSELVIGACIEVHRELGAGLLESAYADALAYELTDRGIGFTREVTILAAYKGRPLSVSYRADFVVEGLIVVELKAVEQIVPIYGAQLLTYLRASGLSVGLLVNFNSQLLRNGLRRISNGAPNL